MRKRAMGGLLFVILMGVTAQAGEEHSHQKYFKTYGGTATCLKCHEKDAESFFHSRHYQWRGEAPGTGDSEGRRPGKMNAINDFCANPSANWIDLVRNSRGEVIWKGCSAYHAGLGKLPADEVSREQLENIDCLICHATGYRRDLYPDREGGFEWKPILWKNREELDSVSKRISAPTRTMCLRCHSISGGGPNWKHSDIESILRDPEPGFDVHMASSGNDMQCVACHAGKDHRVRGRGADPSASDSGGTRLACDECHGTNPHEGKVLNAHGSKVYCTSCHIPTFARSEPTDMIRDWSTPVYDEEKDSYEATITFGEKVEPVYAWFNGKSHEQLMGEPIERLSTGEVGIVVPQGSREDPESKLYAFELHRSKLPILRDKQWLIPIVVEKFFADGDIDHAVRTAAMRTYGISNPEIGWVDTVRYVGIFHAVPPASEALGCLDCHSPSGRLEWTDLGYEGDPLEALFAEED